MGKKKEIGKHGVFRPEDVTKRVTIDLSIRYQFFRFFEMICCIRNLANGGEKVLNKPMTMPLREVEKTADVFLIVTIVFSKEKELQILIFLPTIYILAFAGSGKWFYVSNFSSDTDFTFAPGNCELRFDSSYFQCPSKFSYSTFLNKLEHLYSVTDVNERIQESVSLLYVVISESVRFHRMFAKVTKMFTSYTFTVELDESDFSMITDWGKLSCLWLVYSMGIKWNPNNIQMGKMDIPNAAACRDCLALLKNVRADAEKTAADYSTLLKINDSEDEIREWSC